jgi:hypothetical protein
MALWSRKQGDARSRAPLLVIEGLDVFYGRAHALQGVGLASLAATAWAKQPYAMRSPV